MSKIRPINNNAAFARFTFDVPGDLARQYDAALVEHVNRTQKATSRGEHLRELVRQFVQSTSSTSSNTKATRK